MTAVTFGIPASKRLPNHRKDLLGILCPDCAGDTGVIDSRAASRNTIRRRRVCFSCQKRFTTFEIIAEINPHEAPDALRKQAAALREAAARIDRMADGEDW